MTDELKPCCDYTTDVRCIFYESDEFGVRCRMKVGIPADEYGSDMIRPETCDMHFTRDEMKQVIVAWNARHEPGGLQEPTNLVNNELEGRCKFFKPDPAIYRTCVNFDWHHNGTYRCGCEGEPDLCKFWNENLKFKPEPEELPEWVKDAIRTRIDKYRSEQDKITRVGPSVEREFWYNRIEALKWVLSLRKPDVRE